MKSARRLRGLCLCLASLLLASLVHAQLGDHGLTPEMLEGDFAPLYEHFGTLAPLVDEHLANPDFNPLAFSQQLALHLPTAEQTVPPLSEWQAPKLFSSRDAAANSKVLQELRTALTTAFQQGTSKIQEKAVHIYSIIDAMEKLMTHEAWLHAQQASKVLTSPGTGEAAPLSTETQVIEPEAAPPPSPPTRAAHTRPIRPPDPPLSIPTREDIESTLNRAHWDLEGPMNALITEAELYFAYHNGNIPEGIQQFASKDRIERHLARDRAVPNQQSLDLAIQNVETQLHWFDQTLEEAQRLHIDEPETSSKARAKAEDLIAKIKEARDPEKFPNPAKDELIQSKMPKEFPSINRVPFQAKEFDIAVELRDKLISGKIAPQDVLTSPDYNVQVGSYLRDLVLIEARLESKFPQAHGLINLFETLATLDSSTNPNSLDFIHDDLARPGHRWQFNEARKVQGENAASAAVQRVSHYHFANAAYTVALLNAYEKIALRVKENAEQQLAKHHLLGIKKKLPSGFHGFIDSIVSNLDSSWAPLAPPPAEAAPTPTPAPPPARAPNGAPVTRPLPAPPTTPSPSLTTTRIVPSEPTPAPEAPRTGSAAPATTTPPPLKVVGAPAVRPAPALRSAKPSLIQWIAAILILTGLGFTLFELAAELPAIFSSPTPRPTATRIASPARPAPAASASPTPSPTPSRISSPSPSRSPVKPNPTPNASPVAPSTPAASPSTPPASPTASPAPSGTPSPSAPTPASSGTPSPAAAPSPAAPRPTPKPRPTVAPTTRPTTRPTPRPRWTELRPDDPRTLPKD